MPNTSKGWVNYPSPLTQLDAPALIGLEGRVANYVGAQEIGPGVAAQTDFLVAQAGGGSMIVNVGGAGVLQRAVISLDSNGGTERYEYSGAQLTGTVTTANGTNPRIDLVTLAPSANVDSQVPQVLIIAGTPTAGATLGNRNGAAALPPGRILLADILVAAGATSILTAAIRDRRPFFMPSVASSLFTQVDQVAVEPNPGLVTGLATIQPGVNDGRAGAVLCWLPRRILAARLRWQYSQGAVATTTNYQFWLYDASGRYLANTATTAFTGAANSIQARNEALSASVQMEAGLFWLAWEIATMTASSSLRYSGTFCGAPQNTQPGVSAPNIAAYNANPTALVNTSMQDAPMIDAIAALLNAPPVPAVLIGA